MIIYLPCRLGETFEVLKFKEWKDGKRVYVESGKRVLKGFDAFDCKTRSLSIPTIHTSYGFVSYDPSGEFSQEFVPRYKISVDVKTECKLSEIGFHCNRRARLCGLLFEDGVIMADFVTADRHEHLRYQIKDNLQYVLLSEPQVPETVIEYCKGKKTEEQLTIFDFMGED